MDIQVPRTETRTMKVTAGDIAPTAVSAHSSPSVSLRGVFHAFQSSVLFLLRDSGATLWNMCNGWPTFLPTLRVEVPGGGQNFPFLAIDTLTPSMEAAAVVRFGATSAGSPKGFHSGPSTSRRI